MVKQDGTYCNGALVYAYLWFTLAIFTIPNLPTSYQSQWLIHYDDDDDDDDDEFRFNNPSTHEGHLRQDGISI